VRIRQTVGGALILAFALASSGAASTAAAATGASLQIEPANVAVANGASFSVKVVQNADVATSGAQASIVFDPRILQIDSVAPGPAYQSAPIFLPKDLETDIWTANTTGRLAQVAAAQTPPNAVPPGAADFLVVRFQVVACGETEISLPQGGPFNAQMISGQADRYGFEVPVATTASGHVTTCVGPDGVTAGALTSPGTGGAAASGIPLGVIALAGVVAVGLLGGLAVRSRRLRPATGRR
jgi:hypothetical protein